MTWEHGFKGGNIKRLLQIQCRKNSPGQNRGSRGNSYKYDDTNTLSKMYPNRNEVLQRKFVIQDFGL